MKPDWSGCDKPKSGTLEMALIKHVCRETGLNNALGERAPSFLWSRTIKVQAIFGGKFHFTIFKSATLSKEI
jgi:hypothetical protein